MDFKSLLGASQVAKWLRICLPTQQVWVRFLVRQDPSGLRASKPVPRNSRARAPGIRARRPEKPLQRGALAWQVGAAPPAPTKESSRAARKPQCSQK